MQRIQRYYPLGMIDLSPRTLAHGAGLGRFRRAAALAAGPRAPVPRERSAD
jgi:hypothetical protein